MPGSGMRGTVTRPVGRGRRRLGVIAVVLFLCAPAVLFAVLPVGRSSSSPILAETVAERLPAVEAWAGQRRARVSVTFLDRETGQRVGLHDDEPILTASVAKLFIASQLALADVTGQHRLTPEDEANLGLMLSASDDSAASQLWEQLGGPALVGAVSERYGLTGTFPPDDGLWWHTHATTADVVTFYDQLLDERAGASLASVLLHDYRDVWAERILGNLHRWTDTGTDGYSQRFGLGSVVGRAGLGALKQGWMCCVAAQWIHLTTGIFGPGDRYLLAVQTAEDVQYTSGASLLLLTSDGLDPDDESAAHARDTVTGIVAGLLSEAVPYFAGASDPGE